MRRRKVLSVRRPDVFARLRLPALVACLASTACAAPPSAARTVPVRAAPTAVALATAETVAEPADDQDRQKLGCEEWPFSDDDKRALGEQALVFFERIQAAELPGSKAKWTVDEVERTYPAGLVLVNITHGDDEWLSRETLTGRELVEWLNRDAGKWLFHGMEPGTLRSPDRGTMVGARWQGRDADSDAERLCVGDTEGTEGMFPGQAWVLLPRTQEEIELGFWDGTVVLFDGDPQRGFRVSGLVKPCHGV